MSKHALSAALVLACLAATASSSEFQGVNDPGDNVILVTLDGARTQEMFGGLDAAVLASTLKEDETARGVPDLHAVLGGDARGAPAEADAVPVAADGDATDRSPATGRSAAPCSCATACGSPTPATRRSCSASRTTTRSRATIRCAIRTRPCSSGCARRCGCRARRWRRSRRGASSTPSPSTSKARRSSTPASSRSARPIPACASSTTCSSEAKPPWDGIRHDAFTFRLAMHHLATARPRVLYIAFDETDDWAHDGRYDLRARRLRAASTTTCGSCGPGSRVSPTIAAARTC